MDKKTGGEGIGKKSGVTETGSASIRGWVINVIVIRITTPPKDKGKGVGGSVRCVEKTVLEDG
ncbi:hypothetical protein DOS67_02515 [Staphylococcus felis]|nr:hypothetical protein DOS67_02515 [Staphylococcus felis]